MTRAMQPGYFRRLIRWLPFVLVCVPAFIKPEEPWLGPGLFIMIFDGLSYGPEAMMRTAESVGIAAGLAVVLAVFGPRKKQQPKSDDSDQKRHPETKARTSTGRVEPTVGGFS
ncbi:hypothetical protein ACWJJH_00650 [Endozoicomonadaceae bacterium StTr2]